jgi:hypothetical protein
VRKPILAVLVLLVLLAPAAQARMVLTPADLRIAAGSSQRFEVFLQNTARTDTRFELESDGHGLSVRFERRVLDMVPGEIARFNVTVRAPLWASGEYRVDVRLIEDGAEVETQAVRVVVDPFWGLPSAVIVAGIVFLGSSATLAAVGALVWWRQWHHVFWVLYARIQDERLREHPSRALLIELASRAPPLSLARAQEASGLANGPFEHHLGKLVAANIVAITARGRSRFLHLPGPVEPPPGLGDDILRTVDRRGRSRAADVARELDVSRQAMHYQIRRLAEAGRLEARLERGRLVLDVPLRKAPESGRRGA